METAISPATSKQFLVERNGSENQSPYPTKDATKPLLREERRRSSSGPPYGSLFGPFTAPSPPASLAKDQKVHIRPSIRSILTWPLRSSSIMECRKYWNYRCIKTKYPWNNASFASARGSSCGGRIGVSFAMSEESGDRRRTLNISSNYS